MAGRFVHHAKASRRVQVEKAELEQQVSALTGGLGYSNFQGMERAKQKIMAETAAPWRAPRSATLLAAAAGFAALAAVALLAWSSRRSHRVAV